MPRRWGVGPLTGYPVSGDQIIETHECSHLSGLSCVVTSRSLACKLKATAPIVQPRLVESHLMNLGWMSLVWPVDWEERVVSAVQAAGYRDMFAFVNAYPCEGFRKLATRLDSLAPPAMIGILYLRDADAGGCLRTASLDAFLREFRDILPTGWKNYDGGAGCAREIHLLVTWGEWVSAIDPELHIVTKRVGRLLWEADPAEGWIPSGPDDPILRFAFEDGWPNAQAPSNPNRDADLA
jgi:hypothetical protein